MQKLYAAFLALGVLFAVLVGQNLVGTFISADRMLNAGASDPANQPTDAEYERVTRLVAAIGVAAGQDADWNPSIVIKASTVLQAYATNGEIGVTTGLLRILNDEELSFVMAHEVTHMLEEHLFDVILLRLAVLFSSAVLCLAAIGGAVALFVPSARKQWAVTLWAISLVCAGSMYANSKVSVANEWSADRGAVMLTQNPEAGARSFEKMIAASRANTSTRPSYMLGEQVMGILFPSHPPIRERIAALRQ